MIFFFATVKAEFWGTRSRWEPPLKTLVALNVVVFFFSFKAASLLGGLCVFFPFKPIFYLLLPSVLLSFRLHIFPLNTDHIWPSPVDAASLFLWQIVGIPQLVHPLPRAASASAPHPPKDSPLLPLPSKTHSHSGLPQLYKTDAATNARFGGTFAQMST